MAVEYDPRAVRPRRFRSKRAWTLSVPITLCRLIKTHNCQAHAGNRPAVASAANSPELVKAKALTTCNSMELRKGCQAGS